MRFGLCDTRRHLFSSRVCISALTTHANVHKGFLVLIIDASKHGNIFSYGETAFAEHSAGIETKGAD